MGYLPAMRVVPAGAPMFQIDRWWKTREGQKAVFFEWAKTLAFALGTLTHVGIAGHCSKISLALPVDAGTGLPCLVLKDVAQAAQPLMIRAVVDALGPAGSARFVRYALWLVVLSLVKGVSVLHAGDSHRYLARHRV